MPPKPQPWASGPGEILAHGISLLRTDNDANRRLSLLSIDNAVEQTIKTFLGLPKRVTGLNLTRKEYEEISESFPRLLDALNTHAPERLGDLDLGEIEWYHRLRNQLYHEGNGLTVEKDKVVVYARLAQVLYESLFGAPARVDIPEPPRTGASAGVLEGAPRKAWFYLVAGNRVAATVNARGSCSLRTFQLPEGTAIKKWYATGDYQQQFLAVLEGARLLVPLRQPNLERECRERLPDDLLVDFKAQIAARQRQPRETTANRIVTMLQMEGKSLCDDCLSRQSGITPRQQVNGACRQLEARGALSRDEGRCSSCGLQKIVNRTA